MSRKPVFLDTAGLLALWDTRDGLHERASLIFEGLLRDGRSFFTTELVLAECANALARRPARAVVVELRNALRRIDAVELPSAETVEDAWEAYARGQPGGPSVVDLTSFAVMRSRGMREAFTHDRHFSDVGFDALLRSL